MADTAVSSGVGAAVGIAVGAGLGAAVGIMVAEAAAAGAGGTGFKFDPVTMVPLVKRLENEITAVEQAQSTMKGALSCIQQGNTPSEISGVNVAWRQISGGAVGSYQSMEQSLKDLHTVLAGLRNGLVTAGNAYFAAESQAKEALANAANAQFASDAPAAPVGKAGSAGGSSGMTPI